MEYTFYRITHPEYPELNYIGSTNNYYFRKHNHEGTYYNEKWREYNKPLYRFIREQNIPFEELQWTVLLQLKTNIHEKLEQMFIDKYDSINNGLNNRLAYYYGTHEDYYKQYRKTDKYKEYKKQYQNQKISCIICNKMICKGNIPRHKKSFHN